MSKEFNLMCALIDALGYEHEIDRVIDNDTYYIVKKKQKKEKEKFESAEFIRFWNVYPRKTNKEKAKLAFKKVNKSDFILIMHDIVSRYEDTENQYIPHATTYLNGKRWLDEKIKKSITKLSKSELFRDKMRKLAEEDIEKNGFTDSLDS